MIIPDKHLFRPDEAAKLLGVHIQTIRRWIREDKLSSIKTMGGHSRIPKEEIERLLTPKETTE